MPENTSEQLAPQALLHLAHEAEKAGLMAPEVPVEKMRELLAVRQAYEADEARKDYSFALAEFQRRAPIVEKADDANGKSYAALDRIWRTIRPITGELGLAIAWQVCEIREVAGALVCHLEGTLSHRRGHTVPLRFDMPVPDPITSSSTGKVVQNKPQVFGSAMTYAKRYAECAVLGVVTGEDDDGNGGVKSLLDPKEVLEIKTMLDAWRGTPGWTQDREEVFWRFTGAPRLKSGGHDLGKIAGERFGDIVELLKRSMKGGAK
jgi:hypothetical protein